MLAGTEYERYLAFQDAPAYEKDYATGWKILAGIAVAVVVGVAIGALVFATGGIAAAALGMTAAQLAVGTGVITAGAGMLATVGTYLNDRRNGTTSSIFGYIGNSYTASVTVGGALEALYLSLAGAEALTYLMTGGSMTVQVFGTVINLKDIMAGVMMLAVEAAGQNVLFQLDDLRMFLVGEKPLRAPTENQLYDTTKAWTEMITGYFALLGLQNPRTYGSNYEKLPGTVDAGASGSKALVPQNTDIVNAGSVPGPGVMAPLQQMNALAATYAPVIPDVESRVTFPSGANGTTSNVYTDKIKWGIHDIVVRPEGKGFWGQRIRQGNPRVDRYELKINPQNESYYLPHPEGGYVQFENMINSTVQDGKLIMQQKSFYNVKNMPDFAKNKVLQEAKRQTEAASAAGYKVEWLVSDENIANQLTDFFKEHNIEYYGYVLSRIGRDYGYNKKQS